MIPHLSNLLNINNLNNFNQLFSFNKSTQIFLIPKIYNENNPYINTFNNNYQLLIYCKSIETDTGLTTFLSNFLNNSIIENKNNESISLFEIEDNNLNFVDILTLEINGYPNFTINLNTKQDLIFDDLNIIGIYYNQPSSVNIPEDKIEKNFKNIFKLVARNLNYNNYNLKHSDYYMFPDSQDNSTELKNINFTLPYTVNNEEYTMKPFTSTSLPSEKIWISYSEDNFQSKNRIKQYRTEYFDHIIPNINNQKQIAIAYKTLSNSSYMYLDVYKEGVLTEIKLNNISSIQQINENVFQIVKDFILYECNFNQDIYTFYNFKELENLNTYLNGNIKHHENIIKYGSNIISEKQIFNSSYSTHYIGTIYINGVEYMSSSSPFGSGEYYILQSHVNSFDNEINQPIIYEFNNFIIFPRKKSILPINIKDTYQKKTVYNENNSVYFANRKENSIVKIDNFNNVNLLENDAELISETGNKAFYKVKTNIAFEEKNNNQSLFKIYNNINDIYGALENIELDSTGDIFIKVDNYDIDSTNDFISFSININNDTMKFLLSNNKFLNLLDSENNYYIEQNGYIFNNISELKNNFMDILNQKFSYDEIIQSDYTDLNNNYIDNVIGIQNSVEKPLFVIYNNTEQLKIGYNFIENNKIYNKFFDDENNNYKFLIDYFIDSDGTIYNENEINYKLYNINTNSMFNIVFNVKKNIITKDNLNFIYLNYIVDNISNCETYYNNSISKLNLIEINSDSTNINIINDTTTILLENVDTTSFDFNLNLDFDNSVYLDLDETLNINIELKNYNLNNDINYLNIFDIIENNDFLNINITDYYYNNNIYHFDFIGKTFNTYKINLSNESNFITFGNIPKKCKSQLSTQYDYSADNIVNDFYGDYSTGILYNIIEQNSSKYFNNNFIANESFTQPTESNYYCDAYYIKRNTEDNIDVNQLINTWPANKKSHTLFIESKINDLVTYGNNLFGTYSQTYYLAQYGINYNVLLNGISSSEQILGSTIKPPKKYNSSSYLFDINNCIGTNVYNFDNTATNKICVTLNTISDTTNYLEKLYIDSTNINTDIYYNRIDSYYNNGYEIYNMDFGNPIINDYKNNSNVIYFTKTITSPSGQESGGYLQTNIIDFDYELSENEVTYLSNNINNILTSIYSEKRKMGKNIIDNEFSYKFIDCGSYTYDLPRSNINIKIEKKYSIVSVYVNNILVDEIVTNSDRSIISNIKNYGNIQSGDKQITMYKTKNIITKEMGIWC